MPRREKITLTLPAEVMDAVRQEAEPRGYSQFIAEAVMHYVREQRRLALRERLIEGYQASAEHDRLLAQEWRHAEDDGWPEYPGPEEEKE